jgi:hypothetical protein
MEAHFYRGENVNVLAMCLCHSVKHLAYTLSNELGYFSKFQLLIGYLLKSY